MSESYKASAKNDTLTVWCYDDVGPDWAGMVSGEKIAPLVESFNGHTINVRINSPGGDIDQGFAIFNALERHPAHKVVDVDGLAASIASFIAMVGDTIRMAPNSMMMIHDPWTTVSGNAKELRKTAQVLDKFSDLLVKTYAARSGQSTIAIARMMDDETWMTASEAVAKGFCDEVTKSASAKLARVPVGKFRKTPRSLVDNTRTFYRQAEIDRLVFEFGSLENVSDTLSRIAEGVSV